MTICSNSRDDSERMRPVAVAGENNNVLPFKRRKKVQQRLDVFMGILDSRAFSGPQRIAIYYPDDHTLRFVIVSPVVMKEGGFIWTWGNYQSAHRHMQKWGLLS